ncbi:Saccharopine dehydrogenase [NADP(+), L-glutamate-forming] [Ascosphaera pollenicola]|nr:Saccharopine dehydrogenase [NADP(+), L-glutamate-forming] [Ascosphaera pollenicola]
MKLLQVALSALTVSTIVLGAPAASRVSVVAPSPQATYIGGSEPGGVESFKGIPFAKPPVKDLRLKPPQRLTESLGKRDATDFGPICPQFVSSTEHAGLASLPNQVLGKVMNSPLLQANLLGLTQSEDCLSLHIYRPAGTKKGDKLPVLFWIFGGGFELGWSSMYPGEAWVQESVNMKQPIIYVAVSYRVGGFGFLPGKEVKEDGAGNLGLLDQRLGLEWISDNIESFGGDPDRVTIWGESAGAISVFDQMILYDGNNTYKDKPLFHGGIMNSGSAIPVVDIDAEKPQAVYDAVAKAGGCDTSDDSLQCLRNLDYSKFLDATTSVPGLLSYHSLALSYLPRPDGKTLTASPDVLGKAGKYPYIPIIIGDQEDEGTLFGLFESNITTKDEVVEYLQNLYFGTATIDELNTFVSNYDDTSTNGSPFRTGTSNNVYPQFKRLSAILGDLVFTLTRRVVLQIFTQSPKNKAWSYLSSYDYGLPVMGTFHGSDIFQVFFGLLPNYASRAFKNYYISFVNHGDPNNGSDTYPNWPQWKEDKQLLNMYSGSSKFIKDDFRQGASDYITDNINSFYF